MGKDKVVIATVFIIVISAITFGVIMAYRTYMLPILVDNIDETISMLKDVSKDNGDDKLQKYYLIKNISISKKIKEKSTSKTYKFTDDEINELYNIIGGKSAITQYLQGIENKEEQRRKLEDACYNLKIITSEELNEIWNNN